MVLTQQQRDAVGQGEAVPLVVDGNRCVLVREDVYERAKRVIDTEMDPQEAYPAILEAWDSVGSPLDGDDYR
jgi:hypothetical protein